MKIFFTSDQHFGHLNIIKYCNRPFYYVEEMNRTLIDNWNSVVGPDDLVYIIGDISMSYNKAKIKEIFDQLNGIKILIKGNHDRTKNIPTECFQTVCERLHLIGDGYDFILVHNPAEASANHFNKQKYLCGHLHRLIPYHSYDNWYDVGVDANGFTPVSLEHIIKTFKNENEEKLSIDELLQSGTPDCS